MNDAQTGLGQLTVKQGGKTRYVFAASRGHEQDAEREPGTKICPRCGQLLFQDMDVCYGCLYDFSRNTGRMLTVHAGGRSVQATPGDADARPAHDPLASIELDEIDEEQPAEGPTSVPRHRREKPASADDTLDLSVPEAARPADEAGLTRVASAAPTKLGVWVNTPNLRVWVGVPAQGLVVGRDAGCDLVLRSREVSRRHLQLVPGEQGLVARDLGATNPATIKGKELLGEKALAMGDVVMVCGTELVVAACGREEATDGYDS